MTNLLNPIILQQPVQNIPVKRENPTFTFDTTGKIKPLNDKGTLLPSKIFDTPSEIISDFGNDMISVGKAVKGKANDHELGRINDLAMKAGGLGLASYLFVKNPLKLSKAMEFAGLGTFVASMALWPKLAIQAPIKARTGVDIHQKYIDSQGRKKMLYQDPQYVLTDLYSKDDLNAMGKKLKVNENLPDRESYIKQRAQKTALQGNTLWMMTAGFATPLMSALGCNVLEKPLSKVLEKSELAATEKALERPYIADSFRNFTTKLKSNAFDNFLAQNADKKMTPKFISEIAKKVTAESGSAEITEAFAQQLSQMSAKPVFDETFVKTALKGKIDDALLSTLSDAQRTAMNKALQSGNLKDVAQILSRAAKTKKPEQQKLAKVMLGAMDKAKQTQMQPTLGQISDEVKILYTIMSDFNADKKVLDKYIGARVGDNAGSYIANQWGRFTGKVIDSLAGKSIFREKELKAIASGNLNAINKSLAKLAKSSEFDGVVLDLINMANEYDKTTGKGFADAIAIKMRGINDSRGFFATTSDKLAQHDFVHLADKLFRKSTERTKGTVEQAIKTEASERACGARSSFYRMIQAIDLHKKISDGSLQTELQERLTAAGKAADDTAVQKLIRACNKVILTATTVDNMEKLTTKAFDLSVDEYKIVMETLFGDKTQTAIERSLGRKLDSKDVEKLLEGFKTYKREFMDKVANWQNGMTPELAERTVDKITNAVNGAEKNNLTGKSVAEMLQDVSKQKLNSNKWLKIFGGAMVALTAATLIATTTFGRKDKTEKQVEAEIGANG